MNRVWTLLFGAMVVWSIGGCSSDRDDAPKESSSIGGMKCGAGKCGGTILDGNALLAKKKTNVMMQMREDDTRRVCVMTAKSTKALYDCVRNPENGKLTKKCGAMQIGETMKCGAGKCGTK